MMYILSMKNLLIVILHDIIMYLSMLLNYVLL